MKGPEKLFNKLLSGVNATERRALDALAKRGAGQWPRPLENTYDPMIGALNALIWVIFKAIYSFDSAAVEAMKGQVFSLRAEDYRTLPFPGVYINADFRVGQRRVFGFFFSTTQVGEEGVLYALLAFNVRGGTSLTFLLALEGQEESLRGGLSGGDRRLMDELLAPALGLVRLLCSRSAAISRASGGTNRATAEGATRSQAVAWNVSHRKAADFVVPSQNPAPPAGEQEEEAAQRRRPRLRRKTQMKKHEQHYWVLMPSLDPSDPDSTHLIREVREKKAKILNEDAPGGLPSVERDVPL